MVNGFDRPARSVFNHDSCGIPFGGVRMARLLLT